MVNIVFANSVRIKLVLSQAAHLSINLYSEKLYQSSTKALFREHRTERTRGENKSCIKLDSNPLFVRCVLYHCHCLMSHERMIEIVLFNLQHSTMSLNFVLHLLFKLLPRKKRIKTRNPKLCAFN